MREGGTLVLTCGSGWVDAEDLVFEGGQPGPLRAVTGLWVEEYDPLNDGELIRIEPSKEAAGLVPRGNAIDLCERIHLETARPLAHYASAFYAGEPCLAVNEFGKGRCYYVAFRTGAEFTDAFIEGVVQQMGLAGVWPTPLPIGVNVQRRASEKGELLFIMNFNDHEVTVSGLGSNWIDITTNQPISGTTTLSAFGVAVIWSQV